MDARHSRKGGKKDTVRLSPATDEAIATLLRLDGTERMYGNRPTMYAMNRRTLLANLVEEAALALVAFAEERQRLPVDGRIVKRSYRFEAMDGRTRREEEILSDQAIERVLNSTESIERLQMRQTIREMVREEIQKRRAQHPSPTAEDDDDDPTESWRSE